jgi:hypothetical protein
MLARFLHAGAGKDVMEMRKQHIAPGLVMQIARYGQPSHCGQRLGIQQRCLAAAVAALDARLCGVATGKNGIEFPFAHG